MPLYGIILSGLVFLHIENLSELLGPTATAWAFGLTATYILVVMIFGLRHQRKKDRETIDPMLEDLRKMREEIE